MPRWAAFGPAYLAISWRSWPSSPVSWAGIAAPALFGYQCTMAKSTAEPAMERTVRFQSAVSPLFSTPSGQLPGRVSTAPILIVGSTAFIADAYCRTLLAYVVGLLLAWLSASQFAP